MVWVTSGKWLQGVGFNGQPNVIWANDTKPYWRTEYLLRESVWSKVSPVKRRKPQPPAPIHYKGKRTQPTIGLGLVRSAMRMAIAKNGWHILEGMASSTAGYEADDMAALLVTLNRQSSEPHKLYLVTCDHDWIGLVDEHTTWCNTYGAYPRLRDLSNWSVGHYAHLQQPRDIWQFKAQTGDSSDNLPNVGGNPEGTKALLPVIDLLEPPEYFNPLNDAELVKTATDMLTGHTELYPEHLDKMLTLERSGVLPAMKPVTRQITPL